MEIILYSTISLVIFMVVDLVWLGFIAKKFYKKYLAFLFAENVKWWTVILFYVTFAVLLNHFVIMRASSMIEVTINGLLFGLVTYSTYDLVNHATVRDWPWQVTVVDIIWGTFITTFVSVGTFFLASMF